MGKCKKNQPNIETLLSQNIRNKDIWGCGYTLSYDICFVRCFQLHCHCGSVTVVTLWHVLSEKAKSPYCFCRHISVHDYVKSF